MARNKVRGGAGRRTLPALLYQHDPIRQSVQRLGRKWVLLLIRDLAFLQLSRFGEFRRNNPGLSARVLSRRLREMQREGLLVRETRGREIRYRLTRKGEAAALILLAFLQYGLRHHAGPIPPTVALGEVEPGKGRPIEMGARPMAGERRRPTVTRGR